MATLKLPAWGRGLSKWQMKLRFEEFQLRLQKVFVVETPYQWTHCIQKLKGKQSFYMRVMESSQLAIEEGPWTMVGIATFDSTIHFYNLKSALQRPLMLIVPDVQDVYTPLQTDVIVQLSECRQHLDLLLESIPSMFQNNKTADSAFGAGMKAAFMAMKSTGGKLLVFQSGETWNNGGQNDTCGKYNQ